MSAIALRARNQGPVPGHAVVEGQTGCLGDSDITKSVLKRIVTGDVIDRCEGLLTPSVLASQADRFRTRLLVLGVVPEADGLANLRRLATWAAGDVSA
ncbi:MAG: hypothetical protein AB7V46_11675 [Thermomicrobiales bacterium]